VPKAFFNGLRALAIVLALLFIWAMATEGWTGEMLRHLRQEPSAGGARQDGSTPTSAAPPAIGGPDLEGLIYVVRAGDTLWDISRRHGVTVQAVVAVNGLADPDSIVIGQRLIIPAEGHLVHVVRAGDTLWGIARRYNVRLADIIEANPKVDLRRLVVGQRIKVPAAEPATVRVAAVSGGRYIWPLRGRLTSYYGPRWGRFHHGIDIAASPGAPVMAARSGTVRSVGWMGGYGLTVIVDHDGGHSTLYGHLSRTAVRAGEAVRAGQVIGYVGNTGNSTGPHLHFEVRVGGRPEDPLRYLERR